MRRERIIFSFVIIMVGIIFSGCASIGDSDVNNTVSKEKSIDTVSYADEIIITTNEVQNEAVHADEFAATRRYSTIESDDGGVTTTTGKPINVEVCTTMQPFIHEEETTYDITTQPQQENNDGAVISNTTAYTKYGIQKLPSDILEVVNMYKNSYPNMRIGVGIYSLDGCTGYEYNAQELYNGACTIKASYACYVLIACENRGIDIYNETIEYQARHQIGGSGVIQYSQLGTEYTIEYLLSVLLSESDNDAYMMLLDEFPLGDFYNYNSSIGGQNDWSQWGRASVTQRKNEWLNIWRYVSSGSTYSYTLRQMLTGTQYAYLCYYSAYWHQYMHKSGWTEDTTYYPAAADCMIVDDSYLIIVMTEDQSIGSGRIDAVASIGRAVEDHIGNYGSLF